MSRDKGSWHSRGGLAQPAWRETSEQVFKIAQNLGLCLNFLEKGHLRHECQSQAATQKKKDELVRENPEAGGAKAVTIGEA